MQDLDWSDLRFALAVARHGTQSGAARALGVDDATVSRRLARLRAAFGDPLFERARDGRLSPTPTGRAVAERAEAMEREASSLTPAGPRDAVHGSVRLTAVPILANRLLAPAAGDLLRRHPQLRLELAAEPANLSLTRRDADMALRLARPATGGQRVLARRIGRLDYAVYAAADRPHPAAWIGYGEAYAHLPPARWIAARSAAPSLTVNDAEALLEAAAAGAGRTLLPRLIADRDPRLQRIRAESGPTRELWLLTHRDLAEAPRIRAVAAWLEALLRAEP